MSRKPEQNFFVQIKGTHTYTEKDGGIKYLLKSLAFPAFMRYRVTLDPGILFVVINPDERGYERVFWKYMSIDFLHSLDFNKESATIYFTADEEKKKTRYELLANLRKNPLLARTCLFHFLAYLAGAIEEGRLSALSAETAQGFDRYFPRQKPSDRQSDNLRCLFWAFRVFLRLL